MKGGDSITAIQGEDEIGIRNPRQFFLKLDGVIR
jgi:hypothetical protein